MFNCLFSGMMVGFDAVLRLLPLYEQLSGIKEQLIAACLGVPTIVVSVVLFVPTIVKIIKFFFR